METIRPYVERSLEAGVEQMGLKPEQVQPATLRSVATSAGWAALLSGAGGSETAKRAVEREPVELLRLAEQSPELMALHPEIGEVIAQRESGGQATSTRSASHGISDESLETQSNAIPDNAALRTAPRPAVPNFLEPVAEPPANPGESAGDRGPVVFRDLIRRSAVGDDTRAALDSGKHPGIDQEFDDRMKPVLDKLHMGREINPKGIMIRQFAEQNELAKFIKEKGYSIPLSEIEKFNFFSNKSFEHTVWRDKDTNRAIKLTKVPELYGINRIKGNYGLDYAESTPLTYMDRWRLFNEGFNGDVRIEGFVLNGDLPPSIVISQPWYGIENGEPIYTSAKTPNHLDDEDVSEYMTKSGFLPGIGYGEWYRPSDGLYVYDAHTGNFIKTAEGVVIPIDLGVKRFSKNDLKMWGLKIAGN